MAGMETLLDQEPDGPRLFAHMPPPGLDHVSQLVDDLVHMVSRLAGDTGFFIDHQPHGR